MPSPKGHYWLFYIHHRLKMLTKGIAVYATDKYTRLDFDKYVESNKVCDTVAGKLTNYQPTLLHFGAAQTAPNSPIGIKKSLRCPGNRKILRSYKKFRKCHVHMVDEYYTSQTCAKCFSRFDPRTKRNRFKLCSDCRPHTDALLPSMIVAQKSKRMIRKSGLLEFLAELECRENQSFGDAAHPNTPFTASLLPKVAIYHKTWLVNPVSGVLEYVNAKRTDEMDFDDWAKRKHKTTWHRDIVAAKCILIKGTHIENIREEL